MNYLSVACPFCHAAVGEHCTLMGRNGARFPLRRSAAHPSRIERVMLSEGFSEAEANEIVSAELVSLVKRYRATDGASSRVVSFANAGDTKDGDDSVPGVRDGGVSEDGEGGVSEELPALSQGVDEPVEPVR